MRREVSTRLGVEFRLIDTAHALAYGFARVLNDSAAAR
jgi:hypothetical protein